MFVNTAALHTGANVSDRAGDHASAGADRLLAAGLVAGVFGDFDAAADFHDGLHDAKEHHTRRLQNHQQELGKIATKVRTAASDFTGMDADNAQRLRDVVIDDSP